MKNQPNLSEIPSPVLILWECPQSPLIITKKYLIHRIKLIISIFHTADMRLHSNTNQRNLHDVSILMSAFIEVRQSDKWLYHTDADWVLMDYNLMESFFGATNWHGFKPIAGNRGLPADISDKVRSFTYEDDFLYSWITLDEIQKINWDETSTRLLKNSDWEVGERTHLLQELALLDELTADEIIQLEKYNELQKGKYTYKYESYSRQDMLTDDSKRLLDLMLSLSKEHGPSNVRLVVWFNL